MVLTFQQLPHKIANLIVCNQMDSWYSEKTQHRSHQKKNLVEINGCTNHY